MKGKLVFSNDLKHLPTNPSNCRILCNSVFDNFILVEELFAKALQSFETCVLPNNNLCGKLFPSLESRKIFDQFQSYLSTIFYSRF